MPSFLRLGLIAAILPAVLIMLMAGDLHAGNGDEAKKPEATGSVELVLSAGQPEIWKTSDGRDTVKIKGFSWHQSPGNPRLPGRILNVLLPPEADLSTVQVSIEQSSAKELDKLLDVGPCPPYAAQQEKSRLYWGKNKNIVNGRNSLVYGVNAKFPSNTVQLVTVGKYGELKYAKIRFMPVQYNPVKKKLTFHTGIRCRLEFATVEKPASSADALRRLNDPTTQKIFTNADEAGQWYLSGEPEDAERATSGALSGTGYLIVTTSAISETTVLDDFIAHKEGQGWTVTVATEDDYGWATGQTRCDNIRTWLQSHYQPATLDLKYVLLVGDPRVDGDGVPMKMCYPLGKNYNPTGWPKYTPTDYYYADLTGDWGVDGDSWDGEYGSKQDGDEGGVDFMAEVYVGRIPVYSLGDGTTLTGILDKIINYQNASIPDRKWRRSILLPESFSDENTDGAYLAEEMLDSYLEAEQFSYYRMYQQGNYDSGYDSLVDSSFDVPTNCEQEMRAGSTSYPESVVSHWSSAASGYGVVQWWGHGNQRGAYAGFGGHEDDRDSTYYNAFMYSSWVGALDDSKPSFTMQVSCTNADPADASNLAYSLLKHGAIATVAGTNVTWYMPGQQVFHDTSTNAGIAYEYVKRLTTDMPCGDSYFEAIATYGAVDETDWWNFMCLAIYGDPSCFLDLAPYLEITTQSLSNCEVDGDYSVFLQAQNGAEPYTWSIVSGSLPPGLSLAESTGEISGSPTTAGSFSFTIEVTDSATSPETAQKSFSICVLAKDTGLPAPAISAQAFTTSSITWEWTEPGGSFDSYLLHGDSHEAMSSIAKGTTTYTEGGFGPNALVSRHFHTVSTSSPATVLFSSDFTSSSGWSLDPGGDVEDQSNTGSSSYGYYIDNEHYVAQSFTSGTSGTLSKIEVVVYKYPSANSNLTIEIRPNAVVDEENVPGDTPLGSVVVPITEIPGGTWQTVSAVYSILISAGESYWIVLTGTDTSTEGYLWRENTSNTYSGGQPATSGSSTGPWILQGSNDTYFTTYTEGPGWQIDSAQAGGGSAAGNPDPDADHTDTGNNRILGYAIGDDYTNNLPKRWAISPAIDCSTYHRVTLNFWRWLNVEEGIFDQAYIYVTRDGGGSWTSVWSNPMGTSVTDSSWVEIEFPITDSAVGGATVQVGFVMGSTDGGLVFSGWNIDDLEITGVVDTISNASAPAVSVYTLAAVPGAITVEETGSLTVSWEPNGNPDYTVYELEKSVNDNSSFSALYTGTTPSYHDTAVDVNETYVYRVRAINGDDKTTDWVEGEPIDHEPTAVTLQTFTAAGFDSEILVEWETASEICNLGYNLYRSESGNGGYVKVNDRLISGVGTSTIGGRYCFLDRAVANGKTYFYMLEDLDIWGNVTKHGPVSATPAADAGYCDFDSSAYTSWATSDGEYENVTTVEESPPYDPTGGGSGGGSLLDGYGTGGEDLGSGCRIVESAANHILIHIKVPSPVFGKRIVAAESYDTVYVPGYGTLSDAGKPDVPVKGFMIPLPGTALRASAAVLESVSQDYGGIELYVPASQEKSSPLPQVPEGMNKIFTGRSDISGQIVGKGTGAKGVGSEAQWEEYPDTLCTAGKVVRQGAQRFLQLDVTPVAYNRVLNTVTGCAEILAKVSFTSRSGKGGGKLKSGEVFSTQWDIAAASGVKIKVKEDGIYRVAGADLLAAGLNCRPDRLMLFEGGRQVAVLVEAASGNALSPDDCIIFYGRGKRTIYSDVNTYWLIEGPERGMRMTSCSVAPRRVKEPGSLPAACFTDTARFEQDKVYWANPLPDGSDHWFWSSMLAPQTQEFVFNLAGVDSGDGSASLSVTLRGGTDFDVECMDHVVNICLNGEFLKKVVFDGMEERREVITVPQSALRDGENVLRLETPSIEGVPANLVALNRFDLTYRRICRAQENALAFEADSGTLCRIDGFTGGEILLFDVTSPTQPVVLANAATFESGGLSLLFELYKKNCGRRTIVAVANESCLSPVAVERNEPSNLHSGSNLADYILVTHGDFAREAEILASHRDGQGLRTLVADIEDIYDEFSYGNSDARALKAFLKRVFESWQKPAPKYVLLLGDGTCDYKDCLGLGDRNFVPAYLVETLYMHTASDNYYACVSGDDNLPDLCIGRLPAASAAQAEVMVNKIIAYDESPSGEPWQTSALFVADNDDAIFTEITDALAGLLTPDFQVEKAYLPELGLSLTREKTIAGLNAGSLITTYVGHGSVHIWAGEPIISSSDVTKLTNGGRLTFVVALDCFNGYFMYPYMECIAEEFLRNPDGGAVAYWGATGLSTPDRQKLLGVNLFDSVFQEGCRSLGEATTRAKLLLAGDSEFSNILETWVLFGDPATKLK